MFLEEAALRILKPLLNQDKSAHDKRYYKIPDLTIYVYNNRPFLPMLALYPLQVLYWHTNSFLSDLCTINSAA